MSAINGNIADELGTPLFSDIEIELYGEPRPRSGRLIIGEGDAKRLGIGGEHQMTLSDGRSGTVRLMRITAGTIPNRAVVSFDIARGMNPSSSE